MACQRRQHGLVGRANCLCPRRIDAELAVFYSGDDNCCWCPVAGLCVDRDRTCPAVPAGDLAQFGRQRLGVESA